MKNSNERDILISVISDMEKEQTGKRWRRDFTNWTDEQLDREYDWLANAPERAAEAARVEAEYQATCGVDLFELVYGGYN